MNKCIRFFRVKLMGYKPLESTFINTKPKIRTILPDCRLSFNNTFKHLNQKANDAYRKNREFTLEVSK